MGAIVAGCCNRRHVLAAGAAMGMSALLPTRGVAQPGQAGGRRIDVHHHFTPPAYIREEQKRRTLTHGATSIDKLASWAPERSLEVMDQNGIERAIGSISMPGVWHGNVAAARILSRLWNEAAAAAVAEYPARFGFFAVVAPPDPDGALAEIAYALDTLKADGIALVTNYDGKLLGDPTFAPVLEELNRRRAIVYVHPTVAPCCASLIPNLIPQIVEFPAETMRTITSLLMSGALARLQSIRWIFSHGGGTLPFLAARLGEIARFNPAVAERHPQGIEGQLKLVYCDTASAYSRPQLAAMTAFFDPTHILFGSDFPFVPAAEVVEGLAHYDMPDSLRRAIDRDNAIRLWPSLRDA